MTKQNLWMYVGAVLAIALFTFGCGGGDDGLSAEDMARISAAEMAAMMAQEEAAEAAADAAEAEERAIAAEEAADDAVEAADEAVDAAEAIEAPAAPVVDTSALDAAIKDAEDALADLTADPPTIPEKLGGEKSTASAADLAAASTKIAGEMNELYDHDIVINRNSLGVAISTTQGDKSLVNLPKLGTPRALTRDVSHASQIMESADDDGNFLTHAFGTGTEVDLTSPGDVATLKLGNLLKVDGVTLMSVSMKETDKVMDPEEGMYDPSTEAFDATGTGHTRTTTLRADGSMSIVIKDNTDSAVFEETTTYAGGSKIVEYDEALAAQIPTTNPAGTVNTLAVASTEAVVVRADGDTLTIVEDSTGTMHVVSPGTDPYAPANPVWTNRAATGNLPASDQAEALAAYAASTVKPAQQSLMGYGAWLTDSFFIAYRISAEDDAIISDPDEVAMKVAFGGREHDSAIASDLSGRGETATWKGLMVGHDMDATADTANEMLKGNASITARLSSAVLADRTGTAQDLADVVDVSLTNIITGDGTMVSRVMDGIHWTNLDLYAGSFAKGTEITGAFYDNGNEVVGQFSKEKILGVFGAVEYE